MAGIYIHIPFCKSRCKYCDFYSTTMLHRSEEYVLALHKELQLRKQTFEQIMAQNGDTLQTVYFGGGTPSCLCESHIVDFLTAIRRTFDCPSIQEVTMEANPGDLSYEKLQILRQGGINRLSIGIQSFQNPLLSSIGRRHNCQQAIDAVKLAQAVGFNNISIDLMYGLPSQTMEDWGKDVSIALSLGVQHISAYCLTYEEGTPLYNMLQAGEVHELDDELLNQMQEYLEVQLQRNNINRYEVSNYCIDGYRSLHNCSYWTGAAYMGLGAGAHSYDGHSLRQYNPNDLSSYLDAIQTGKLALCDERLSSIDQYNERIMLSLRTVEGIKLDSLTKDDVSWLYTQSMSYEEKGLLEQRDGFLRATNQGVRILNRIIADLMKEC